MPKHTLLWVLVVLTSIIISTNNWAETYAEGKQAYLDKDYEKALQILRPLAEAGDSQAQITLGIMYDYGQGVPADPGEALMWYKMAANQGIPIVQHDIGVKYFKGMGVEQDYLEAVKWWEMSANAGLADSQFNLGLMYYRGLGIPQDYSKAAELFQAAADQGHGRAQYSLAVMYAFGQEMDKDYQTALELFNKSAVQGVVQAQFNLGVFYENGYGLDKDMTKAKEWFEKAAANGLQEAVEKLAELNSQKQTMQEEQPAALPVAVSDTSVSDLNKGEWLRKQPPDNYTLQLGSVINEQDIVNFIRQNNLGDDAAYIEVVVNGVTRYTAIYGLYNTYEQAEMAVQGLPDSLQNVKPWIRNTGILQGLLR